MCTERPTASINWTVMSNVPVCDGVPASVPVESGLDTIVKPDGNPVADQV